MNQPDRSLPKPRPRLLLEAISKSYPPIWQYVDQVRAARGGSIPTWPEWAFMPTEGWSTIEQAAGISEDDFLERTAVEAVGTWRTTQGIYRYDPALYDCIITTPLNGDLPCDVLYRMPEWCVYIESPGLVWVTGCEVYGFFARLSYSVTTRGTGLAVLVDTADGSAPFPVELGAMSLRESVEATMRRVVENAGDDNIKEVAQNEGKVNRLISCLEPLMSLLLYLCTVNAEIGDGTRKPAFPRPTKTKKGLRLFPPDQPFVWDVGVRMGAALRAAYQKSETGQGGTHAGPRPHVRRQHWHGFWEGPKNNPEQRRLKLKWLPPIPVNLDNADQLVPVIRQV